MVDTRKKHGGGLPKWSTPTEWTWTSLWGCLSVSWKVEVCTNVVPVARCYTMEIDLRVKSFQWNVYAKWMKWYKPSVTVTLKLHRSLWVMLGPGCQCSTQTFGVSTWYESGISWAQAWAFKQLHDIHPDESFRMTLKGPKPMPYGFGTTYLSGLFYCAGLHMKFGVIGPKQPDEVNQA